MIYSDDVHLMQSYLNVDKDGLGFKLATKYLAERMPQVYPGLRFRFDIIAFTQLLNRAAEPEKLVLGQCFDGFKPNVVSVIQTYVQVGLKGISQTPEKESYILKTMYKTLTGSKLADPVYEKNRLKLMALFKGLAK